MTVSFKGHADGTVICEVQQTRQNVIEVGDFVGTLRKHGFMPLPRDPQEMLRDPRSAPGSPSVLAYICHTRTTNQATDLVQKLILMTGLSVSTTSTHSVYSGPHSTIAQYGGGSPC